MAKNQIQHNLNVSSILDGDKKTLYEFMCHMALISDIRKDKMVDTKYSISIETDIKSIIPEKDLHSSKSYPSSAMTSTSASYLFYKSSATKTLGLLRHLRNSIAHDNIAYDSSRNSFQIKDYELDKLTWKLSAYGNISRDALMKICNYVITNIK